MPVVDGKKYPYTPAGMAAAKKAAKKKGEDRRIRAVVRSERTRPARRPAPSRQTRPSTRPRRPGM